MLDYRLNLLRRPLLGFGAAVTAAGGVAARRVPPDRRALRASNSRREWREPSSYPYYHDESTDPVREPDW